MCLSLFLFLFLFLFLAFSHEESGVPHEEIGLFFCPFPLLLRTKSFIIYCGILYNKSRLYE